MKKHDEVRKMRNPELVDRFMEIKHPERFAKAQGEASKVIVRILDGISEDEVIAAQRARKRQFLEQLPTDNIDSLGLTVDDLLNMYESKLSRKRGGQKGGIGQSYNREQRDIALHSFVYSERENHTFSEAVTQALERISGENTRVPDQKTVKEWLNVLIESKVTSIEPGRQGRPKKRNS